MNALSDFLQKLLDHVSALIPVKIVYSWQQGVRTRFGVVHSEPCTAKNGFRGTGIHFYWPLVGGITCWECNLEVFETGPQRIGEQTFSLLVQCQIDNLPLYFKNVQDELKESVGDTVRAAAGELALVSDKLDTTWAEVVRKLAHSRMRGWGVDIKRVSIASVSTVPALHLIAAPRHGALAEDV